MNDFSRGSHVEARDEAERKLRDAEAALQGAFRAMECATRDLMEAFVEYEALHGELWPPYDNDNPNRAKLVKAHRDHRAAEVARDDALARIEDAKTDLLRFSAE